MTDNAGGILIRRQLRRYPLSSDLHLILILTLVKIQPRLVVTVYMRVRAQDMTYQAGVRTHVAQ